MARYTSTSSSRSRTLRFSSTSVWHGLADANVPPEMGRHLADRIPDASRHFVPEKTHLTLPLVHDEELLQELVSGWAGPPELMADQQYGRAGSAEGPGAALNARSDVERDTMDKRTRDHADLVAEYCTNVEAGDRVLVTAAPAAGEFLTALFEAVGERGGDPLAVTGAPGMELPTVGDPQAAHLRAFEGEFEAPEHLLAALDAADVYVGVRSEPNVAAMAGVPEETLSRRAAACEPFFRAVQSMERWCMTQHPTAAWAQWAGMSVRQYREFVYDATLRDWEAAVEDARPFADRLEAASEIRIEGDGVDLTVGVGGMLSVVDEGKRNAPGGEVFTAPVPDAVDGRIAFDYPLVRGGVEIEDVALTVEAGEVVEATASSNEAALKSLLDTDPGARRFGEVGFGTNDGIDRFTGNVLFDEKMTGTMHLALGAAYPQSVGDDREGNESGVHADLLADLDGVVVSFDGDPVVEDGELVGV